MQQNTTTPYGGDATAHTTLRAESLVRRFGRRRAVNDVSLSLNAGDCLALFGPNGAGKTTLLRMLGGLLKPTQGRVEVNGHPVRGDWATRSIIGVLSHHTLLYAALTARENVRFAAECHGVRNADAAALRALEQLEVQDRADTPVRLLSRGLQQRVSIARALVHEPGLVLLDEPYTGLDEIGARALTRALTQLVHAGATLVLVTHNLAEGLAMATRAAVMLNGRIVRTDTRDTTSFDPVAYGAEYRALVGAGE